MGKSRKIAQVVRRLGFGPRSGVEPERSAPRAPDTVRPSVRSRALVLLSTVAASGLFAPAARAVPALPILPAVHADQAAPADQAKPEKPADQGKPERPADQAKPTKPTKPVDSAAPGARAKPAIGFADQKPSMFDDPRFVELRVRHARLNVPWDVLQDRWTLANVDAWMAGARGRGVAPLLTVDRSRRPGLQSRNPSAGVLATQVRKWRRRWPGQVRQISSWNEGNINKRPALVAQWYLAIRGACPGCTVLGADLVDRNNAVSWAQRFIKAAKRVPAVWGLHNYIDSNTFKTTNTRAFLKQVKGRVWLTETGGVLNRSRPAVKFSGTGALHAAAATEFLLKKIAPLDSKRIQRVYLYSWSTAPNDLTWDSGLVGPDGAERPALRVVRCFYGSCEAKTVAPVPVPPAADNAQPAGG